LGENHKFFVATCLSVGLLQVTLDADFSSKWMRRAQIIARARLLQR